MEIWNLLTSVEGRAEGVDEAVRNLLAGIADGSRSTILPEAASAILLLADGRFAEPSDETLEVARKAFLALCGTVSGTLATPAILVGTLLWRCLDRGLLSADQMRAYAEQFPDLLRILDSHLVIGTTRLTTPIPAGSPSEKLVAQIARDRLRMADDSAGLHAPNGPFKTIALWPGAEVVTLALETLDRTGSIGRNPYSEALGSSLWHILRRSRVGDTELTNTADFAPFKERTLLIAALVAPWLAGRIERARGWYGLDDLVAWAVAHAKQSDGMDLVLEEPRVERQLARVIGYRGQQRAVDRQAGIVDVAWFHGAAARLGEERTRQIVQLLPLALRETTYLHEVGQALLGEGADGLLQDANDGRPRALRLWGVSPLPDRARARDTTADERLDDYRRMWGQTADTASAQKRVAQRRAIYAGVENLAQLASGESGHGGRGGLLLAWAQGYPSIETAVPGLPTDLDERYQVFTALEPDGLPSSQLIKRSATERRYDRRLKSIPREVATMPAFKEIRRLVTELRPFTELLQQVLDRTLLLNRSIPAMLMTRLLEHPLAAPMVQSLLWELDDEDQTIGRPILERRGVSLIDRDGTQTELPIRGSLTLVHPIRLEQRGELRPWQEWVLEKDLLQSIPQVFRAFATRRRARTGMAGRGADLTAVSGKLVGLLPAIDELTRIGWDVVPGQYPRRIFPDAGLLARWHYPDMDPQRMYRDSAVRTGAIEWETLVDGDEVADRHVPELVRSEALRDASRVIRHAAIAPLPTVAAGGASPAPNGGQATPASMLDIAPDLVMRILDRHLSKRTMEVEIQVDTSEDRVELFVRIPGRPAVAQVEVRFADASVSAEGRPVNRDRLPVLRDTFPVPHPIDEAGRLVLETVLRVIEAIDIDDASVHDALRATGGGE